jgi:hypothetical protein
MTFSVNPLVSTSPFARTLNNEVYDFANQANQLQASIQQAKLGAENRLSSNPPPAVASFTSPPFQTTAQTPFGPTPSFSFVSAQGASSGTASGGGSGNQASSGGQGRQGSQQQGFTG